LNTLWVLYSGIPPCAVGKLYRERQTASCGANIYFKGTDLEFTEGLEFSSSEIHWNQHSDPNSFPFNPHRKLLPWRTRGSGPTL